MYALKPIDGYRTPSRARYRFRRFLLSRSFWYATRLVLPLLILCIIVFRTVTSPVVHEQVANTKQSIVNWVAFLPGLKIDQLAIENATKLQEGEIYEALNVELPSSIILLDRDLLREKMSVFDEVGDSSFRFGFDGTLYIGLKPRNPRMIYMNGDEMITVDQEGHRVEHLKDRSERKELFVISGEGAVEAAPEALKIIKALQPYASRIRGLMRMGSRRWDIILVNDARLKLPAENPLDALSLILIEHQKTDVLNRDISVFDMRNPERPILRLNTQAIEEMRALEAETTGLEV